MEEKLKRLIYPDDCIGLSIYCQIALRILEDDGIEESQEDLDLWLKDYDSLYWALTNQPPGLPAIPRTTCDRVFYPVLREFWRKYHLLKFPVKDDVDNGLEEDTEGESEPRKIR
jgi:hypothetical protein